MKCASSLNSWYHKAWFSGLSYIQTAPSSFSPTHNIRISSLHWIEVLGLESGFTINHKSLRQFSIVLWIDSSQWGFEWWHVAEELQHVAVFWYIKPSELINQKKTHCIIMALQNQEHNNIVPVSINSPPVWLYEGVACHRCTEWTDFIHGSMNSVLVWILGCPQSFSNCSSPSDHMWHVRPDHLTGSDFYLELDPRVPRYWESDLTDEHVKEVILISR